MRRGDTMAGGSRRGGEVGHRRRIGQRWKWNRRLSATRHFVRVPSFCFLHKLGPLEPGTCGRTSYDYLDYSIHMIVIIRDVTNELISPTLIFSIGKPLQSHILVLLFTVIIYLHYLIT